MRIRMKSLQNANKYYNGIMMQATLVDPSDFFGLLHSAYLG